MNTLDVSISVQSLAKFIELLPSPEFVGFRYVFPYHHNDGVRKLDFVVMDHPDKRVGLHWELVLFTKKNGQ